MDDLIERLSKATGPDRELGNAVLLACGWRQEKGPNASIWYAPGGGVFFDHNHPDPTRSIDAAMALMPCELHAILYTETNCVELYPARWRQGNSVGIQDRATAATVPLALCIALLEARARQGGQQ